MTNLLQSLPVWVSIMLAAALAFVGWYDRKNGAALRAVVFFLLAIGFIGTALKGIFPPSN